MPRKQRFSYQKETIFNILYADKSHPSVDTIYQNVQKEIPNISLGTVYRNLNAMADEGRILRLDVGDGVVHFDADTTPHLHMLCTTCHSIIDLDVEYKHIIPYIEEISKLTSHKLDKAHVLFTGECHHCSKKNS